MSEESGQRPERRPHAPRSLVALQETWRRADCLWRAAREEADGQEVAVRYREAVARARERERAAEEAAGPAAHSARWLYHLGGMTDAEVARLVLAARENHAAQIERRARRREYDNTRAAVRASRLYDHAEAVLGAVVSLLGDMKPAPRTYSRRADGADEMPVLQCATTDKAAWETLPLHLTGAPRHRTACGLECDAWWPPPASAMAGLLMERGCPDCLRIADEGFAARLGSLYEKRLKRWRKRRAQAAKQKEAGDG